MSEEHSIPRQEHFPIIGVGASAGGLAALKRLFGNLPEDSGLAFVVVQHLDPEHKSQLVELLSHETRVPVVQITDGMAVIPNRIHVIPPNHYLKLSKGRLRLSDLPLPRGIRRPIDQFLSTLAEDQLEQSICIILSGTGSDGTRGLREIKQRGGMAMVQAIETAEYDGMPRSALSTQLVDYVLPPEHMADVLIKYATHFTTTGQNNPSPLVADITHYLNDIIEVVKSHTSYDFHFYKKGTLSRRIERRMGLRFIGHYDEYLEFLRSHADEASQLAKDMLIGVTAFFRDPEAFDILDRMVIPTLLHSRGNGGPIRVWVPGCSSGEEAYSIAMLLHERISEQRLHCGVQIFASDIDAEALEKARFGLYPKHIAADVSPSRLQRFFTREGEDYRVSKVLRESVIFASQNLITDPPFSKIDLISCRNLLIYLKQDLQKELIRLFHFALRDPGFLFLGPSETVSQEGLFRVVSPHWRIYRSEPQQSIAMNLPFSARLPLGPMESLELKGVQPPGYPIDNLGDLARLTLLEEYAPASLIINQRNEVLYFFGATSAYLQFPSGAPTRDLLAIVQEGLRTKVRSAVLEVIRGDEETKAEAIARMRRGGHYRSVHIRVCRLKGAKSLLLISFEDVKVLAVKAADERTDSDSELVKQLEYELKITREDLQSSIEEMETSNEELKASNEEAMSMNEELQSTNEELETSKEELQSLNEELNTVNNQLQEKIQELESINNDLANLLSSTEIATLFLDASFRIKRFTPSATTLFNLIPTDLGRPITDIAQKFHGGDLITAAQEVLRTLQPLSEEVKGRDDRWYIRRMLPYRTVDGRIDGVVVTFSDIRDLKLTMQELQESEERFRILFQKSPICLSEQDWSQVREKLDVLSSWCHDIPTYIRMHPKFVLECLRAIRITKANEATQRLFRTGDDTNLLSDPLCFYSDQHLDGLAEVLIALADHQNGYAHDEWIKPLAGAMVPVYLSVLILPGHEARLNRVLVTLIDITGRKAMEKALHEREQRLQAILNNAADALITTDPKGHIHDFNHAAEQLFGVSAARAAGSNILALISTFESQGNYLKEFQRHKKPRKPRLHQDLTGNRIDGHSFPLEMTISEIGHLGLFLFLIRDVTERKRLEREVIDASTLEQERIGRELHDDLGQQLTALDLLSTSLWDKLVKRGSPESSLAENLKNNLQIALTRMRAIARGLAPVEIDPEGLVSALAKLIEDYNRMPDVSCTLKTPHPVAVGDGRTATHLFRIAQEAMNNAIKHANARRIELSFEQTKGELFLCVKDDGQGLPASTQKREGMGMRIMDYRAHLIGGRLQISSKAGKGTSICCVCKLP